MAYFRIQRMSGWWGHQLPVSIFIDGEKKGEIPPPSPGRAVDFPLPGAGVYDVYFMIDGCKSAVYTNPFLKADEFITLEVELPDDPYLSCLFRRNNFGRLIPRSPAIATSR